MSSPSNRRSLRHSPCRVPDFAATGAPPVAVSVRALSLRDNRRGLTRGTDYGCDVTGRCRRDRGHICHWALRRGALVRAGEAEMAAGLRKAVGALSIHFARAFAAKTGIRPLLYSGPRSTALSAPAFEQRLLFLRVRADRPTSGIDWSAHERFFEHPSLDRQSRRCTRSFRQSCREGAASCRPDREPVFRWRGPNGSTYTRSHMATATGATR